MTNLITVFLQNNSTCNKEALQNVGNGSSIWREKTEVRSRNENWEKQNNSSLPVHCLLGHRGD